MVGVSHSPLKAQEDFPSANFSSSSVCFVKIRRLMSDRVKEQWRSIISDCRHLLHCQKLLRKAEQGPTTTATLLAGADNSTAHPRSSAAAHLLALTTSSRAPISCLAAGFSKAAFIKVCYMVMHCSLVPSTPRPSS